MKKTDYIRIATVLYCHQFICYERDEPTIAAEMVHAQLAGTPLSMIVSVARKEELNEEKWELERYFK